MIDAFSIASSQPWAIEPEALQTVLDVAARLGDPEALATKLGRPLDNTRTVTMRDGTAVIPIRGPIFRHAGMLTEISGATATATLALDIRTALDNKFVSQIVLDIDSPGGEAAGIQELANLVYAGRLIKPIKAFVGGTGASAAYWIGSAASQIIVAETAIVGSIGVVMSHMDTTERDMKSGVRRVEIVSSASPDKRIDPSTEAGRARVQALVDSLGEIFVRDVARNRGTTTAKVLSDFGKGFVMTGADAVRAGMADGLGSLEGVLSGQAPRQPTGATRSTRADAATSWDAIYANAYKPNNMQAPTAEEAQWDKAFAKTHDANSNVQPSADEIYAQRRRRM